MWVIVLASMLGCTGAPSNGSNNSVGGSAGGQLADASGGNTMATGGSVAASGGSLAATGCSAKATGGSTVASGRNTMASGGSTVASGGNTMASGGGTVASGGNTIASGGGTVASGDNTMASGGRANDESRPNRISACVFNSSAGLGSAADWQPSTGLISAMQWYHVVGEYTTLSQPSDCSNATKYPGSINIWVNGVQWNHASHGQTGCMSQYNVVPLANNSAVNVGTMARDAWFQGAIGKVAIYDYLLSQSQITRHYCQSCAVWAGPQTANTITWLCEHVQFLNRGCA